MSVSLAASGARAQTAPPPQPVAGFQDGFFVQSADGDNRLVFGVVAQFDGKFELNGTVPNTSAFTIRKLRPTASGRVARYSTSRCSRIPG